MVMTIVEGLSSNGSSFLQDKLRTERSEAKSKDAILHDVN